jgi:hypothetical protein
VETRVVHCDCACPFWGKPDASRIDYVRLDCGHTEWASGDCLQSGRITTGLECPALLQSLALLPT